ncbi:unnamed protein product [Didymodactylos carnosus]|uniref:Uncharacterized protein n=1 Tax=Didymodactylos carnosus TaxID=1234261 RepID=A0A814MWC7_9BILA|nr:unnamed protein product [Didymodactylos carnosus]CAF1083937.1 unnamed protein product [Didymodactylos carnosus]CAF3641337.1 unnamed protein product [Didymodactylos carnosus]CAF3849582.1 unnamed protein product [Didymodactylos carnosus]
MLQRDFSDMTEDLDMSLKNVHLITFDVHNVLLKVKNGAPYHYCKIAKEQLNINADESIVKQRFVQAFRQYNNEYPGYGIRHNISSRQWWSLIFKQSFQDYNLSHDIETKLSRLLYDKFAEPHFWLKDPSADDVLNKLKTTYRLGIISNFDERLIPLLQSFNLYNQFSFVLSPLTCGYYKPEKDIFNLAALKGECKTNEQMCHVGDDYELDYLAAKNANCKTIILTKNEQEKNELIKLHQIENSPIITSLNDLLPIFL